MKITDLQLFRLEEAIELLEAIEAIEWHNKNWLPQWAIEKPEKLRNEKQKFFEKVKKVITEIEQKENK